MGGQRGAFQQILQVIKEKGEKLEGILLLSNIDCFTVKFKGFGETKRGVVLFLWFLQVGKDKLHLV